LTFSPFILKQGALLFWALWFTLALLANLCDFLKQLGILCDHWKFASGNFSLMKKTTDVYHLAENVVRLLFILVMIWEALAALLMTTALFSYSGAMTSTVYAAFGVSLGLWAAFLLVDELFVAYPMEATHFQLFIAQLLTLFVLYLLPNSLQ
jgi:hypothetical protein